MGEFAETVLGRRSQFPSCLQNRSESTLLVQGVHIVADKTWSVRSDTLVAARSAPDRRPIVVHRGSICSRAVEHRTIVWITACSWERAIPGAHQPVGWPPTPVARFS
jgi:hypothetical protein